MMNLIIFLIGLALMMLLMMKTKLGPFICMLLASLGIGIACQLGTSTAISTTIDGFAGTCKSIGLLVIFGTILGIYLEKSNACQRIATSMLKITGNKNATLALAITGFLVAIPVFCDVAMVLLSPLIKSVAKKSGKNACALGTVTACSLLSTNAFVAPTPAPLAIIAVLGLDIGTSILWGLPCALFITICVWAFGEFYLCRKPDSWFTQLESEKDKVINFNLREDEMPSLSAAIAPIIVPILLILMNSVCSQFLSEDSILLSPLSFLGNKNIALALGIVTSVVCLASYLPENERYAPMSDALKIAGPIVFITAAGGALAKIVGATGVGETIANLLVSTHIPVLLVPFLIAGFSKFAQGSASVAGLLAAGLSVPLCEAGLLTPLEAFLSISAGASLGSHVNNSFFWVFSEFMGYDARTTMKTLCVSQNIVMSLAGIVAAFIVSMIA
ncbi:GntP family gluconate:H+ symporter [Moryella indoligenes]|uniref:GntP family gluconate:H+ symporter n=1 Tax=Moryella indoligenes TaxID=371674 RepID=A0AAE3V8P1_9FIRM|nr:GntP family permease [Moryella indoligenes]MDQ0151650.1 GntP family gluconate:H+ symporter [Moryella indoligenes]